MTSSPLTTCAPVSLPITAPTTSSTNSANIAKTTTSSSKPAPVVLSAKPNAEIEFSSQETAPNSEYFSTDDPVDVDEALENNEPASQVWITTEGGQDENQGWGDDQGQENAWDNQNDDNNQAENWGNDQDNQAGDHHDDNAWGGNEGNNAQDEWQPEEQSDEAYNTVKTGDDNDWQQSNDQGFETVLDRQEESKPTDNEWQEPNQENTHETSESKIEGETWATMDENDKQETEANPSTDVVSAAGEAAFATAVEETKVDNVESQEEVNKNSVEEGKNAAATAVIKPKTSSISPARRAAVTRKFQSLDLNLNVDGAAGSVSSGSDVSSQYWHNYSFMKHKASWLYGNWSRKGSDASSFVSSAQELEDLYCDDEISPNLENDPNMMLTAYYRNAPNGVPINSDINFPERPCLTDRGMRYQSNIME